MIFLLIRLVPGVARSQIAGHTPWPPSVVARVLALVLTRVILTQTIVVIIVERPEPKSPVIRTSDSWNRTILTASLIIDMPLTMAAKVSVSQVLGFHNYRRRL